MDVQQFWKTASPQIADFVCDSSVGLATPCSLPDIPYEYRASGTLVCIDDRLFVATAAHAIPHNPNAGNLWLLSKRRKYPFEEGVLEFLRHKKASGLDVGYLELEPGNAGAYLDCKPCPVEQIGLLGPGRERRHIILAGAPCEHVKIETRGLQPGIVAVLKPYITTPLMPEEWPAVAAGDRQPCEAEDIFLDFPREGVTDFGTGGRFVCQTAEGYSGGGVWDLGFEPGDLWHPENIRLFGIQLRWHPENRYLRAIQITHWLRLVYRDYPDLRDCLEGHFPELTKLDCDA